MIRSVLRSALHKLCAAFGSAWTILPVCCLFSICFTVTSVFLRAKTPQKVSVALVNESDGRYSEQLCGDLLSEEELDVTRYASVRDAEDALLSGKCEVALTISADYDEQILSEDTAMLITITEAPDAVSGDLLRETVAGKLIAARSAARMELTLNEEGYDGALLHVYASELPHVNMYSVRTVGSAETGERAVFGRGYACYEGVVALSIFLLLFLLSVRLSSPYARRVCLRLCVCPHGRAIAFFGDVTALLMGGALLILPAVLFSPDRSLLLIASLLCYTVCICGLCLFLSQFSVSGRLDLLGPLVALVTSIAGGCFTDLSALGGAFRIVSLFTPQGQMIAALRGAPLFDLLLLAEGALLLLCSAWKQRRAI